MGTPRAGPHFDVQLGTNVDLAGSPAAMSRCLGINYLILLEQARRVDPALWPYVGSCGTHVDSCGTHVDSCGLMWDSCGLIWDSCGLMWGSCGFEGAQPPVVPLIGSQVHVPAVCKVGPLPSLARSG